MIIEESIIGGIISKIINDGTDISKSAIEQAVKKKCKEKVFSVNYIKQLLIHLTILHIIDIPKSRK